LQAKWRTEHQQHAVIIMSTDQPTQVTVRAEQIIEFVDRIVTVFKPRRIVLFGSYACGTPTGDSDVDLLITRQRWSMSPLTAAGRMRIELGVPFAMDLIVRSEADVRRRIAGGDFFLRAALETGITLYAADNARVGRQGRIRLRRRPRGVALAQEVTTG
jgi:predicted nucleotidyltransferase